MIILLSDGARLRVTVELEPAAGSGAPPPSSSAEIAAELARLRNILQVQTSTRDLEEIERSRELDLERRGAE